MFETTAADWLPPVSPGLQTTGQHPILPARAVTRAKMAAFLVRALSLSAEECVRDDDGSVFEGDIEQLPHEGCKPPESLDQRTDGSVDRPGL